MIPAFLQKLLGSVWYARAAYALTALWTGLLGGLVAYAQAGGNWAQLDWHKVAQDAIGFALIGVYNHQRPPVSATSAKE
jgi:cell division protein FtsX